MNKLIGKGAFTKAYMQDNGKVLLISCDPIKEAMAWGWFPESCYFPKVEYIDVGVYEMELLERCRAPKRQLSAADHVLYQQLQSIAAMNNKECCKPRFNNADRYSILYKLFEEHLKAFPNAQQAILEALDACSNYGSDIGFEISPRNIATNEWGQLILADCFFMASKLMEVRRG